MKNKLKYLNKIGLRLMLVIILSGCSLDEKYITEVIPEKYYDSQESVLSVLARPFTHLSWYVVNDRWRLQEITSDAFCVTTKGQHWYNGGSNGRMLHHKWTPDDGMIWDTWRGGTMGIALAMEAQEDLKTYVDYDKLGFPKGTKDVHQMQLQTLIAYFYMRNLDFFGGMPIFTGTTQSDVARSTDLETFNHIEKLLVAALPKLEKKSKLGESEEGFITQAACAMILAQLYFNAEAYTGSTMFDKCELICKDILDGKYGTYALDPTWNGIHGFDNDKSPEMIWTMPSQNAKRQNDWFWTYFYHYESYKYFNTDRSADNGCHLQPSRKPTNTLYTDTDFRLGRPFEKFNDSDLRKKPYVYLGNKIYEGMFLIGEQTNPFTKESSKGTQEYKGQVIYLIDRVAQYAKSGKDYMIGADLPSNIDTGEENSGIRLVKVPQPNIAEKSIRWSPDFPLFRLTEIYYMYAECLLRKGNKHGAAEYINIVRKRNFANGNDPTPLTADDLDDNGYRMLDEWLIEFLGEGRRRTDLIRWKKYVSEKWWDHEPSNDVNRLRFPVPTNALSGSNLLKQNPGY